jgi:hypothetical protein
LTGNRRIAGAYENGASPVGTVLLVGGLVEFKNLVTLRFERRIAMALCHTRFGASQTASFIAGLTLSSQGRSKSSSREKRAAKNCRRELHDEDRI